MINGLDHNISYLSETPFKRLRHTRFILLIYPHIQTKSKQTIPVVDSVLQRWMDERSSDLYHPTQLYLFDFHVLIMHHELFSYFKFY